MLDGKKIVLAVTGSIAAYRAAEISSWLVKNKARVTVLMTASAGQFIGPATFAGLTGNEPVTGLFEGGFSHLDAAKDADLFLIAPATANVIAKLAAGIADDIVTAAALGANCPVMVCPAMNERMWLAAVTRRNVKTLTAIGYEIVGPARGDLACGDEGWGRLETMDKITAAINNRLDRAGQFLGKKLLVTAGPTREYLDPVRFISNPASGKLGYAVAEEAARRGGETTLISGTTAIMPSRRLNFIPIVSASELAAAVYEHFDEVDAVIMTAAVADHRFKVSSKVKIEKDSWPDRLDLVKNPDILAALGRAKKAQVLVGFAAQTEDLESHGRQKLEAKNLDLLVATKVGFGQGFGEDFIDAVIVDRGGSEALGLINKQDLAARLIDRIADELNKPLYKPHAF